MTKEQLGPQEFLSYFEDEYIDDLFEARDTDKDLDPFDVLVTVNGKEVNLGCGADVHEAMCKLLNDYIIEELGGI